MKKVLISLIATLLWFSLQAQEVPVLVDARFNQDEPYNLSCPDGSVTGCGPTAIAEIKAENVSSCYNNFLQTLTRGPYIVKEGNRTRKIMITN